MWVWKTILLSIVLAAASPCADLVIQNVTVIDVTTGAELPKRSVLIRNKQIAAVGIQVPVTAATRIVNGTGKFLIPGLWDMHVHLWHRENQFPLYLANGVTGVRDMGSDLNWVNQWRDQMKAGKLLGPHIETCGPAVDGFASQDDKLPVFVVRGPNDARATFDRLDELQVDFIKVLSGTPRDAYFALIERARKYYVPVAGHVPTGVTLEEAIDARQKSMEHMTGILLACSSNEAKLRKRQIAALEKKDWDAYRGVRAEILETFDPKKADSLFRKMANYDVREVPTFTMLRRAMFADAAQLAVSPDLAYVSAKIRKDWVDPREEKKKQDESTLELAGVEYDKLLQLIPMMKRAGVPIMAGTDTGDPYSFPGFDLHRELELLVSAGLSPLDALRSATLEPSKYFDALDNLGAIEVGKDADLVLLDADPLADIKNTRKIAAVFVAGRYLPKAELNAMLASMKEPVKRKQ
jgi:imidazolonepropionase-like amidohydrolase